jgi:hypothetical protein
MIVFPLILKTKISKEKILSLKKVQEYQIKMPSGSGYLSFSYGTHLIKKKLTS